VALVVYLILGWRAVLVALYAAANTNRLAAILGASAGLVARRSWREDRHLRPISAEEGSLCISYGVRADGKATWAERRFQAKLSATAAPRSTSRLMKAQPGRGASDHLSLWANSVGSERAASDVRPAAASRTRAVMRRGMPRARSRWALHSLRRYANLRRADGIPREAHPQSSGRMAGRFRDGTPAGFNVSVRPIIASARGEPWIRPNRI